MHQRIANCIVFTLAGSLCLAQDEGSLQSQMEATAAALSSARDQAQVMVIKGDLDKANEMILQTFPEESRTPVQSLMMGNVLYKQDPKQSYQLHKFAAAALPDSAEAQLEWAMEQLRRKEYAGASAAFAAFSAANPDYAPAYGLAAECALRLGDIKGALNLWNQSEKAGTGTLIEFETLVCEVHGPANPDIERFRLLGLATAGDPRAAESAILLDCAWVVDWWNAGPELRRLNRDLSVIKKSFSSPDAGLRAALCVGAIKSKEASEKRVSALLNQYGLLIDSDGTIPESGKSLSLLLSAAFDAGVLKKQDAKIKFGDRILESAKKSGDGAMFNVAAHLFEGSDRLGEIDQAGWDAAHEARFAASRLAGLLKIGKLTLDDPLVARAIKEFPDDPYVAGIVLELARSSGKPLQPYLVEAIKAEYCELSALVNGFADFQRPSARAMRKYFAELNTLQQAPGPR